MDDNNQIKIVIADTSVIIRSGLIAVLKRLSNMNVHPVEIADREMLHNYIDKHNPDIIIVNPLFEGWMDINSIKAHKSKIKFIALICNMVDTCILKDYDEQISLCDDMDTINTKINNLVYSDDKDEEGEHGEEQEALSQREKEIISYVVKGMTNKSIADKLYLSIYTVITHRRNIARKLQIRSSAGLTIYAIVNKLVDIKDIKDKL